MLSAEADIPVIGGGIEAAWAAGPQYKNQICI